MAARGSGWGALLGLLVACSSGAGGTGTGPVQAGGGDGGDGGDATDGGTDGGVTDGGTDGGTADGGTDGGTDGGVTTTPPFSRDGWTFYGPGQGLGPDVVDVSADEGGNVYVAGTDALYAKQPGAQAFLRFDSGLTQSCYQGVPAEDAPGFAAALDRVHADPPGPPVTCPIISVGGGAPGVAMIGFKGHGTDGDLDAPWAQASGGADLVAFDGQSVTRTRHVFIASPPQSICVNYNAQGQLVEAFADQCVNPPDPFFWQVGRRKLRQVFRIAVNHQVGSPMYGDTWMGGTHATLTVWLNHAADRGWIDRTASWGPDWADARDVWEHDHPGILGADGRFLTGYTYAIAVDPRTGTPWGSNGFRTAALVGYGAWVANKVWWLQPPWLDVWPDTGDPTQLPSNDQVQALAFCDDRTLWIGSDGHGLARLTPDGTLTTLHLPDGGTHGDSVTALACDPSDGSLWIGLGWGGVMRLRNGAFTLLAADGLPAVASHPVRSIQVDRWSSPRVVYFAFLPLDRQDGSPREPGGVAAYDGQ